MARHAPTSRARVILTSHLRPMYQKSSPTRQLVHKQEEGLHAQHFLRDGKRVYEQVSVCVLTGRLEVGPGGVCRCRGGGSSQSGRQKNSCSLRSRAGTHSCSLLGTAATSHTLHPADLEGGRRVRLVLFLKTGLKKQKKKWWLKPEPLNTQSFVWEAMGNVPDGTNNVLLEPPKRCF